MGKNSKRKLAGASNFTKRRNSSFTTQDGELESLEEDDISSEIVFNNKRSIACQTDLCQKESKSSQASLDLNQNLSMFESSIYGKINWFLVADLLDMFRDYCGTWNSIHERALSVIIYLMLRLLKIKFKVADDVLNNLNCMRIKYAHLWSEAVVDNDDLSCTFEDKRGRYERDSFYDIYPDLEIEAKVFALENANKKRATFTVNGLATFVTKRFKEMNPEFDLEGNVLIRSETSCRVDLIRWGAKWDDNSKRPYFEGHERADVILHREKFINYFLANQEMYYHITPATNCDWKMPVVDTRIIIAHDESTFKSGEVQSKRWFFPESAPFFNKGRGRSLMLSHFIVLHQSEVYLELNETEWRNALNEYPDLNSTSSKLNYYPRSANGWLEPGKDNYVDNEVILEQFERLFILLKYKETFKNCAIEILVDNARTHSAKKYDLMLINKFDSIKSCVYETIEWFENTNLRSINGTFYDQASQVFKTKGLFTIAKELNMIPLDAKSSDKEYALPKLREILQKHDAFTNISKLEDLGFRYGVKIIFCPKYHCELNPIEGFWCFLKQYVRKRNDQEFDTMKKLINEAMERYEIRDLNIKLWKRFWKTMVFYNIGYSYKQILQNFFGAKTYEKVKEHRKITCFNTNINVE